MMHNGQRGPSTIAVLVAKRLRTRSSLPPHWPLLTGSFPIDEEDAAVAESVVGGEIRLEAHEHLKAMNVGDTLGHILMIAFLARLGLKVFVNFGLIFASKSEAGTISSGGKCFEDEHLDLWWERDEAVIFVLSASGLVDLASSW